MLKKGSKLYSILTGTCPKCQNERMYIDRNPYNLRQTLKMHDRCSHCGLKYKLEPNFFFGAMYISYALGVAVCIFLFVIAFALLGYSIEVSFVLIIVSLLLLMPPITRLARNIYINIFVSYDKAADKNAKI